ncbi:hypothetical protein VTN49DRAFT_1568 [Thermomyces lanuginosus]|uniref:uncharacterized protein n=1 Tax=Thermomyces lanuginosus TaxID=5541 RepID=UPI0037421154
MSSAAISEKNSDETSKLKTFLSILRKFIGVPDIASVRFSLPAQLLEPTPNLDYWNYLDRPETFASIGISDDELGRMLEVLRFWFTKDLKHIKGKPCKPYNSTLGEFFRSYWEVEQIEPPIYPSGKAPPNGTATTVADGQEDGPIRVCYLTEQTSHHPPVSAFYIDCPARGISARGFDQISARFTGTSVRVAPGEHNLGIFITLHRRDNEEYHLEHPAAHVGGFLRGSLSISVADTCAIRCARTRLKVLLQYHEDGWMGRGPRNRVEGVIFRYDPANDTRTKIKDVPKSDILARIHGSWHGKIFYTLTSATSSSASSINTATTSSSPENEKENTHLLIDVAPLNPIPKKVPPDSAQLSNESRRFWAKVTDAILAKQYAEATRYKQEIEERQRQKAAARKERGEEWQPRFFTSVVTEDGRPELTEDGKKALRGLQTGDYTLEESKVLGA